jgi:uracil-DNA glycosylase family protein
MAGKKPPRDATPFLPERLSLPALREAAAGCEGCDLYLRATQTVFGEGPTSARVVFVGEQPGDSEDREGRPFVGPAGRVFDEALAAAGIERKLTYVTNAVKHFSFEPRGKARLHKKPRAGEVRACAPWLRAELALIKPDVMVLLGATAAQSIFGADFRVTQERGVVRQSELAKAVLATLHPSAILRAADDESRHTLFETLVSDLKIVRKLLDDE